METRHSAKVVFRYDSITFSAGMAGTAGAGYTVYIMGVFSFLKGEIFFYFWSTNIE